MQPPRTTYLLLSSCAWIVAATGAFLAWMATPFFPQFASHPGLWYTGALIAALLVVFGIPAALILWGAMGYCCSRNGRLSKGARIFWFLLFFTTGWYGSALYFFAVYRRQVRADLHQLPAMETERFFAERKGRADRKAFRRILNLNREGGEPPRVEDRIE